MDRAEHLGIGDDQLGQPAQRAKRRRQFVGRAAEREAAPVQQFPEHLDLRQDNPALGGFAVLRHHQHHKAAFPNQGTRQVRRLFPGHAGDDPLDHERLILSPGNRDQRGAFGLQQGFPLRIGRMPGTDEDRHVGIVYHGPGEPLPFGPQLAAVPVTGRIDQDTGAQPRQFDAFAHRVGRGPG